MGWEGGIMATEHSEGLEYNRIPESISCIGECLIFIPELQPG